MAFTNVHRGVRISPKKVMPLIPLIRGMRIDEAVTMLTFSKRRAAVFIKQALLAAKAGASFISPFVGRQDDIGFDGMALIADIRLIYDNYDFPTEILVASVRHPMHVVEAAKIGADVMTAAPKIL